MVRYPHPDRLNDRYTDRPELVSAILEITGITEADIRSVRPSFACDWFVVRTYNRRQFTVTSEEIHVHRSPCPARSRPPGHDQRRAAQGAH